MKNLIAIIIVLLFSVSCGTDQDIELNTDDDEMFTNDDENEVEGENDETEDFGELRMIEITYKLDSPPYNIETRKVYLENDRPVIDSLWRTNEMLGIVTSYEYDGDFKLIKRIAQFYDSNEDNRTDICEYTYDQENRIVNSSMQEYVDSNNEFSQNLSYEYSENTIQVSDNFGNNYILSFNENNQITSDISILNGSAEVLYQGSNLIKIETDYRPDEKYEFTLDLATPVNGGFDYSSLGSNSKINALILNNSRIGNGGYKIFQENYLTGFTYSYLLNGVPEIQNVQYEYEFDNQGRLKKRIENSDFYPNRELIDYEYFYNN